MWDYLSERGSGREGEKCDALIQGRILVLDDKHSKQYYKWIINKYKCSIATYSQIINKNTEEKDEE